MTRRVCHTGEEAINRGLAKRLDALSKERERANRAAAAADEPSKDGKESIKEPDGEAPPPELKEAEQVAEPKATEVRAHAESKFESSCRLECAPFYQPTPSTPRPASRWARPPRSTLP